jgi:hypothetical protein
MRRTDSQRRHHDSFFVVIVGLANTCGQHHESELHHVDHGIVDHAEGAMASWEAAWIDLGGEG